MTTPVQRIRTAAIRHRGTGFTLIELMVVVAVLGVIALLAGPSFLDMIVMQRLRGINAQLVTDLQFARSEAVARGRIVRIGTGSNTNLTCYVIYTSTQNVARCDCTSTGSACTDSRTAEIRRVVVSSDTSTRLVLSKPPITSLGTDTDFGFDPVTGGLVGIPSDRRPEPLVKVQFQAIVDADRQLLTTLVQTGRPSVCAPNPTRMGVAACPPPP